MTIKQAKKFIQDQEEKRRELTNTLHDLQESYGKAVAAQGKIKVRITQTQRLLGESKDKTKKINKIISTETNEMLYRTMCLRLKGILGQEQARMLQNEVAFDVNSRINSQELTLDFITGEALVMLD